MEVQAPPLCSFSTARKSTQSLGEALKMTSARNYTTQPKNGREIHTQGLKFGQAPEGSTEQRAPAGDLEHQPGAAGRHPVSHA